ncbi:MAG: hypothetical protein G8D89_16385 [gamma proteobacterium symbiont of Clathrolucina costata]
MTRVTGEVLPDEASAMRPLYLSDPNLVAGMAIMDAFPMGVLGYMIAEERAKKNGKLNEFYSLINNLADKVGQCVNKDGEIDAKLLGEINEL